MTNRVDYVCRNEECEHEFEVRFYPSTPDRFMSGRFEDAERGSAAECDPCECHQCGEEVNVESVEREFND